MAISNAPSRLRSVSALVISILLCVAFLGAGIAKLTAQPMMIAEFTSFAYPLWFMTLTGVIEVVAAVLVVVPRTSQLGAGILALVMIGALVSHLTHGQAAMIAPPVVLLSLAVIEFQLRGRRAPSLTTA